MNLHWQATCWCKCPGRWWEEQEPGVEIPESGKRWRHWGRKVVEWCLHGFFVKYHNINEKVQQIFWLPTLDKGCHEDQQKRRVPWSRAASWSGLRVLLRSCLGRPGTRPSWARSTGCKVVHWENYNKNPILDINFFDCIHETYRKVQKKDATKIKSPVSKALIVGAVDRRVDDLVSVDGALNSTVLKNTNRIEQV